MREPARSRSAVVGAKNVETERLKPELDKVFEETLDRLSESNNWPPEAVFRNNILMRVQWFFNRDAYKNDLMKKLLEAESTTPALSKKRQACIQCCPLSLSLPDSPLIPCYAHSKLTGEQHAQLEMKLREGFAERS